MFECLKYVASIEWKWDTRTLYQNLFEVTFEIAGYLYFLCHNLSAYHNIWFYNSILQPFTIKNKCWLIYCIESEFPYTLMCCLCYDTILTHACLFRLFYTIVFYSYIGWRLLFKSAESSSNGYGFGRSH